MGFELFERHQQTLNEALTAIVDRRFYSAYPEIPSGKIYGESAKKDGLAAFEALLNKPFPLTQPIGDDVVDSEKSPYGLDLGITYPVANLAELLPAMQAQLPA